MRTLMVRAAPHPRTTGAPVIARPKRPRRTPKYQSRIPPSTGIDRQGNEPELTHRGLLLWAMQDVTRRSFRAVAAVLNTTDTSIRNWSAKYDWIARCAHHGEGSQARACQLYRDVYSQVRGMKEVIGVEHNMSISLLTGRPPTSGQVEQVASEVLSAVVANGQDGLARGSAAANKVAAEREERRKNPQRMIQVVDALVGQLVKDLKEGKVVVKPGDLHHLHRLRQLCADELGDVPKATVAGAQVEPSYRVQSATRTGGSIVTAMREDAIEALAVLEGLEAAEQVMTELRTAREDPDERGQVG